MNVNIERNQLYYSDDNLNNIEICSCEHCQNYYRNIVEEFNFIKMYLDTLGVDILKPFELMPIDYAEKKEIEYIGCQYIVFGQCEDDFEKVVEGVRFYKNINGHPTTNIDEEHFVMEFGPITLKWQ